MRNSIIFFWRVRASSVRDYICLRIALHIAMQKITKSRGFEMSLILMKIKPKALNFRPKLVGGIQRFFGFSKIAALRPNLGKILIQNRIWASWCSLEVPINFLTFHFCVEKNSFFRFFFSGQATSTSGKWQIQPKRVYFEPQLNPIQTVLGGFRPLYTCWPILMHYSRDYLSCVV